MRRIFFFSVFLFFLICKVFAGEIALPFSHKISSDLFQHLKSIDPLVFGELSQDDVFVLTSTDFEDLLTSAANKKWTMMDFYFDERWSFLDHKAIVIPKEVLQKADQDFEIVNLFPQSGILSKTIRSDGVEYKKGSYFEKEAVIIHKDRLVTIYPHPVAVSKKHLHFILGEEAFYSTNISWKAVADKDKIEFKRIEGRNSPTSILKSPTALFGVSLVSLACNRPCSRLTAQMSVLAIHQAAVPISRRENYHASN